MDDSWQPLVKVCVTTLENSNVNKFYCEMAVNVYHSSNKIEKEKKQLAKEAGMLRSEVQGTEVAEEMEKERRMFQLQMCEVRGLY